MSERTSIMFLDDEPAILHGIRRQLSPFRSIWDMRFETSPVYALENFEREPADVIVTDLKMPIISGDTVANLFGSLPAPPAIIVLTGHGSQAELVNKISVPFEFLNKPCEPVELIKAVSRALYASPSRISSLYDEVLEIVVRKMKQNGLLKFEDLPLEYTTLLGIRNISTLLGEIAFECEEN